MLVQPSIHFQISLQLVPVIGSYEFRGVTQFKFWEGHAIAVRIVMVSIFGSVF